MTSTIIFILGTHPELSFAELEAVVPLIVHGSVLERKESTAWLRLPVDTSFDAAGLMQRLGGTVKIAELIGRFEDGHFDEEKIVDWLCTQLDPATKFHFGFSVYPLAAGISTKKEGQRIQRYGLLVKKSLKEAGFSCRFVSSREPVLSSVIVHKERLLKNGVEVVLLKDRNALWFGKTLAVQPFQAFSKRDYGRPERDVRSGMLPPKIARIMVNLAQPSPEHVLLDPFCGSGTILQEALLLGLSHVIGSDASAKAIQDTEKNLRWLGLEAEQLITAAAENLMTQSHFAPHSVDRIVFEGYLGPPTPYANRLPSIIQSLSELYQRIFPVCAKLLKPDGRIVVALPFWHTNQHNTFLPLTQLLSGTSLTLTRDPLLYRRPQAVVGRQIFILQNGKNAL